MAETAVSATVTELPESRVRVEAEVASAEVERSLDRAARQLGRDLRIPGFRKGKVPTPVVIQRIGRDAVLDEAVRGFLPQWYVDAVDAAGIAPVGEPSLDVGDLPARGEPLTFSIEVGVRPKAQLGPYRDLEVGRAEPEAADEAIDREIDTLRDRLARLDAVERPAEEGDFLDRRLRRLHRRRAVRGRRGPRPAHRAGLRPAHPRLRGPAQGLQRRRRRHGRGDVPGRLRRRAPRWEGRRVRRLRQGGQGEAAARGRRRARRGGGLRHDRRAARGHRDAAARGRGAAHRGRVPRGRPGRRRRRRDRRGARRAGDARAGELWDRMLHSLSHQGIDKDAYLRIAGRTEEDLLSEARPDAEQQLRARGRRRRRSSRRRAWRPATRRSSTRSRRPPQREGTTPKKVLDRLRSSGRLDDVREEVLARKAIDVVADSAKPIPLEQAAAREKIWTPEKGEPGRSPPSSGPRVLAAEAGRMTPQVRAPRPDGQGRRSGTGC